MNSAHFSGHDRGRIFWDVILAIFFGGIVFAILIIATGGLILALVTGAVAIAVFAVFQYLVWGRVFLENVARERRKEDVRARREHDQATPKEEFSLVLTEQERKELVRALEQSLPGPVAGRTAAVGPRTGARVDAVQEVLDRLRGFGA